jgi:hypothetical protein
MIVRVGRAVGSGACVAGGGVVAVGSGISVAGMAAVGAGGWVGGVVGARLGVVAHPTRKTTTSENIRIFFIFSSVH